MKRKMRESLVLKKLRAGENVSCIKINVNNAQVSELAAMAGFNCIWLDQEHIGQDWSILNTQILSAKVHGTDTLVRVPRGNYSNLVKPLEMDATGIMVPHVMNADDARHIIRMTRFHPQGLRAIDGGNADGAYTNIDFPDYLEQANRERFIILQIEDKEALEDIENIASLEGFDMLFFGPGDFSQSIGAPGVWDHPELIAARKRVAEVAIKHGKYAATTGGIDKLKSFLDMGYRFVSVGADVVGLSTYFNGLTERFNKTGPAENGAGTEVYK